MSLDALAAARGYADLAQTLKPAPAADAASLAKEGAAAFTAALDQADAAAQGFASGAVGAQSVVEAIAQAEMALQTVVTVRDRIVAAYQEVLRMPL